MACQPLISDHSDHRLRDASESTANVIESLSIEQLKRMQGVLFLLNTQHLNKFITALEYKDGKEILLNAIAIKLKDGDEVKEEPSPYTGNMKQFANNDKLKRFAAKNKIDIDRLTKCWEENIIDDYTDFVEFKNLLKKYDIAAGPARELWRFLDKPLENSSTTLPHELDAHFDAAPSEPSVLTNKTAENKEDSQSEPVVNKRQRSISAAIQSLAMYQHSISQPIYQSSAAKHQGPVAYKQRRDKFRSQYNRYNHHSHYAPNYMQQQSQINDDRKDDISVENDGDDVKKSSNEEECSNDELMQLLMNHLSSEIYKFYIASQPFSTIVTEKEKLKAIIIECAKSLEMKYKLKFKQYNKRKQRDWDIFTFGSESWGKFISCRDSDIDMAIFVNFKNYKSDKKDLLDQLGTMISKFDGSLMVKKLLDARYPIIRITHIQLNIQIDVSIADRFCKRRDQKISDIISQFENECRIPIKELIVFIKYWSKQKGINNSYLGYLNSFGYTLFVIKFLQYYCFHLSPDKNNYNRSLGYLAYTFFEFYATKFDVTKHAISILSDYIFNRKTYDAEINGYSQMEINDPADLKSNVAHNVGPFECRQIINQFVKSYELIKHYKRNNKQQQSLFDLLVQKAA